MAQCDYCNQRLSHIGNIRLADGNILCTKCSSKIPKRLKEMVPSAYSIEHYKALLHYLEYLPVFQNQFSETHKIGAVHLDAKNGLFYISDGLIFAPQKALIYDLRFIQDYAFTFHPNDVKNSILGYKVYGKVQFEFALSYPPLCETETVMGNAGAKGYVDKSSGKPTVNYEMPKELTAFYNAFAMAEQKRKTENPKYEESESSNARQSKSKEYEEKAKVEEENANLTKVLALFMFDSIEEVTLDKLREQRNKLLKIYHQDNGEQDAIYAQKINEAYTILKNHII